MNFAGGATGSDSSTVSLITKIKDVQNLGLFTRNGLISWDQDSHINDGSGRGENNKYNDDFIFLFYL